MSLQYESFPKASSGGTGSQLSKFMIDEDEENTINNYEENSKIWMPDELCNLCYACEESFSLFRRKHHCRVCGHVFCNNCSMYYIDGSLVKMVGTVRSCKLCYMNMNEQIERERMAILGILSSEDARIVNGLVYTASNNNTHNSNTNTNNTTHEVINDTDEMRQATYNLIRSRADAHYQAIMSKILCQTAEHYNIDSIDGSSPSIAPLSTSGNNDITAWMDIITKLTQEITENVMPDVRRGDDININHQIEVEIVPGGNRADTQLVKGVVVQKNVAYKKMRREPRQYEGPVRILLVESGVDFETDELKFTMLDKILELESNALDLLLIKILSLRPDIMLVGGSINYRILEKLSQHNIVAFQNVDINILRRVSRLTGAELLRTSHHITHANVCSGYEAIGHATSFKIVRVTDDPEHPSISREGGILKANLQKDASYVFIQGVDLQLGCSIYLRGGDRALLTRIESILRFSILLAYHLRLEVAWYANRDACFPSPLSPPPQSSLPPTSHLRTNRDEDSSDEELSVQLAISSGELATSTPLLVPEERQLLSSSLGIDYGVPFLKDIDGDNLERDVGMLDISQDSFLHLMTSQTLSVTSLLMSDHTQKSYPENKRINFYGEGDICLGKFLVENCFQPGGSHGTSPSLLHQTLSFAQNPGHIDIHVIKALRNDKAPASLSTAHIAPHLVYFVPIGLSIFCKSCKSNVTSDAGLSEEAWNMSFGKFLEMLFYNKSAFGSSYGCTHRCRDDHILHFHCLNLTARVEFIPFHTYSVKVRNTMSLPEGLHLQASESSVVLLQEKTASLVEDFLRAVAKLEVDVREIHVSTARNSEEVMSILSSISSFASEISTSAAALRENMTASIASMHDQLFALMPVYYKYPMAWKRDWLLLAEGWNARLQALHEQLQQIRNRAESVGSYSSIEPFSFFGNKPRADTETSLAAVAEEGDDVLVGVSRDVSPAVLVPVPVSVPDQQEGADEATLDVKAHEEELSASYKQQQQQQQQSFPAESEHLAKDDRGPASSSTISKALALFLGTESPEVRSVRVPLEEIADPSLFLPPGRKGEVIPVKDTELASIVAYSLASREYQEQVRRFTRDVRADAWDGGEEASGRLSPTVAAEDFVGVKPGFRQGRASPVTAFQQPYFHPSAASSLERPDRVGFKVSDGSPGIPPPLVINTSRLTPVDAGDELVTSQSDFTPPHDDFASTPRADEDPVIAEPIHSVDHGDERLYISDEAIRRSLYERQMLLQRKSHVKHRFTETSGASTCRYFCTTFFSSQFEAFRRVYFDDYDDDGYILSLTSCLSWTAQGGKSGASFSKSIDGRFVVKIISRTELLMFNDFAPAYFEYMSKALFDELPTVLCKVFGVYQVGYENSSTNKRVSSQLVVMENLFHEQSIHKVFDLKGSTRSRYVAMDDQCSFEEALVRRRRRRSVVNEATTLSDDILNGSQQPLPSNSSTINEAPKKVLLDDNFIQLNNGRPFPLKKRAKEYLEKAVSNDSTFLSVINVVDYSILVGFDETSYSIKVGIIDYMRQYDIIKKMENMGKSVGMLTGQAEPTIIEPLQYKKRFQMAIDRYFMEVPDMWHELDAAGLL